MATYTASVAPSNATIASFKAWGTAINTAFGNFTWVQQNDTGQVVWTATVLTLTQVVGATATYSYSSYTGPVPRVGMSVTITGFATGGNNVTGTILTCSGGASGTFTIAVTTQADETHAGSATTTAQAAPPGIGAYVYEIWATSDSVGFPIYVKVEYGTHSSTANTPSIAMTIGTGTNGAGTLLNPSTRYGADNVQANSATLYACHFCGDGGRFVMMMWHGQASSTFLYVFSLERSYDNTGAATGSYYNITIMTASLTGKGQVIFPNGALTTAENAGWFALLPKQAASGNLGSTTAVSPCFPMVGGIGNPLTNIMVFRATDFADNMFFATTIYGVQQTYIVFGANNANVSVMAVAVGFGTRYS